MDGDGDGASRSRRLGHRPASAILVRPTAPRPEISPRGRAADGAHGRPRADQGADDASTAAMRSSSSRTRSRRASAGSSRPGEPSLVRRQRAALQRLIRDEAIEAVETATAAARPPAAQRHRPRGGRGDPAVPVRAGRRLTVARRARAAPGRCGRPHARSRASTMAAAAAAPHAVRTMRSSRPRPVAVPRSAAPPLIGVVTHELRRRSRAPGWAMAPGRSERDLAPQRLSMRLTYTQAVQEAGGDRGRAAGPRLVDDTGALLDRLDGLLVSGGPDLDPAVYGQERHPALGPEVDRAPTSTSWRCSPPPPSATCRCSASAAACRRSTSSRGGTLHQHLPDRSDSQHLQRHEPFAPGARRRRRARLAAALADRARRPRGELLPPPGRRPHRRRPRGLRAGARRHRRGAVGSGRELLPRRAVARRAADPPRRAGDAAQGLVDAACGLPGSSRSPPDAGCHHSDGHL